MSETQPKRGSAAKPKTPKLTTTVQDERKHLKQGGQEPDLCHRALLLYAMMAPTHRNYRAVARAVQRAEGSIRYYAKQYRWTERLAAGDDIERTAVAMYRELYTRVWGERELPHVASGVAVPMLVGAASIGSTGAALDIKKADNAVREALKKKKDEDDARRRSQVQLVDASIGYVAQELISKKVRVTLRDIPALIALRNQLSVEDDGSTGGSVGFTETVRVRATRAAGGDVLEAIYEDLAEITAIVDALRLRRAEGGEEAIDSGPDLHLVPGGQAAG